jgi:hypothetical protein
MAFNPFHGFRKHQKKIFAVMVIVCMFVFILQFTAGADPISHMMSWFGRGRGKGDVVTTLYGDKVVESDLGTLSRNRLAAGGLSDIFFGGSNPGGFLYQAIAMSEAPPKAGGAPPPPVNSFGMQMSNFFMEQAPRIGRRLPAETLFGGTTETTDLLDFLLWKHQADKLGIVITEADVRKSLNRAAGSDIFSGKSFTSSDAVGRFVQGFNNQRNRQRISADELLDALTDEYRVMLAKEALLGESPGVFNQKYRRQNNVQPEMWELIHPTAIGPAVTPYEFLQFYRDNFSTLDLWIVPVSVEDFMAAARRKHPSPPEDELRRLFEHYKDVEPSPERAEPAFKEPSRVRVEWLVFSRDLPYFRARAKTRLTFGPLADDASIASATTALGGAFAVGTCPPALASLIPVTQYRTALSAEYEEYERRERMWQFETFTYRERKFHDSVYRDPEPAAVTVGLLGVAAQNSCVGAGAVPLLQVMAGNYATLADNETLAQNRMLSAQLSLALSPMHVPAIGCPGGIIPAAAYYTMPVKTQEQAASLLLEELETKYVDKAIAAATTELRDELNKLKSNETEAKKKIDEAIAKYGVKRESMKRAMDRYEVAKDDKDASLKALREAYGNRAKDNSLPFDFAIFLQEKWLDPRFGIPSPGALKGLYLPGMFDVESTKDRYFVWEVEATNASTPKNLAEARKNVEDAWYRLEARNLAREKAEEINRRMRDLKGKNVVAEMKKDPEFAKYVKDAFTLYRVSRLLKSTGAGAMGLSPYVPYVIDTSRIAFAPGNMVDDFVKSLKTPGDSKVYLDRPEGQCYVVLLESRNNCDYLNPTERQEFNDLYAKARIDGFWQRNLMPDRERERLKLLINQLRTESGAPTVLNDRTGYLDYKLPEGVRARAADRGTED